MLILALLSITTIPISSYADYSTSCNIVWTDKILGKNNIENNKLLDERIENYSIVIKQITSLSISNTFVIISIDESNFSHELDMINKRFDIDAKFGKIGNPEHILHFLTHPPSESSIFASPSTWKAYWMLSSPNDEGVQYINKMTELGQVLIDSDIKFMYQYMPCVEPDSNDQNIWENTYYVAGAAGAATGATTGSITIVKKFFGHGGNSNSNPIQYQDRVIIDNSNMKISVEYKEG